MTVARVVSLIATLVLFCALPIMPTGSLSFALPPVDYKPQSPADQDYKNNQDNTDKDNKGEKSASDSASKNGASNNPTNTPDADEAKKKANQPQEKILPPDAFIVVGNRTLTGPFSVPQQRGNRIFLPVVSIARALGDGVIVSPVIRTIEVRRQTGVVADFNAQLNQVRENGAVILVVSNTADIVFTPNQEAMMLPVEIVASLLDVSIITSESTRAITITRGRAQADNVRDGAAHASWELYQLDYTYNLSVYSSSFNHNLLTHSIGRIGDGKFSLSTNFDRGIEQDVLKFRSGAFIFDRPNGQRFVGGDFGTGTDLEFMGSSVRGIWLQQPFKGASLKVFAGRSISSGLTRAQLPAELPGVEPEPPLQFKQRHDTTIIGSYVTFGSPARNAARYSSISSGLMYFNGPTATGEMAAASIKHSSQRNQFLADFGAGNFSGLTQQGGRVGGFASLLDISETFKATDKLNLQGHFTHIGPNYVSPQSGGLFIPMNFLSGGFNYRPKQWLMTSFTAATRRRLDLDRNESTVAATVSVTPRGMLPTIIFTHSQSSNALSGSSAYTLVNATKELNRWRLFGNFTRIRIAPSVAAPNVGASAQTPASLTLSAGAMVRIKDSNILQFSQSIGSGNSFGGNIDWTTTSFFTRRVSLGAGFAYSYGSSRFSTTERLTAALQLPRRQILQFNYLRTPTGPQVIVQLYGPLLLSRRAASIATSSLAEIKSLGSFYGRVYQDINLNGQYDPGVDRPQENAQVRVDGNYYAMSDGNGEFRIDNIKAGEHTVRLDLLSVRADLTLLDSATQLAVLRSGRDAIVDFRLVRTGRIKGAVWLDANGNGKFDEGEQPLADVRVLTGSGRDTLTDGNGEFGLGDLPPGNHIILIDEKTLPGNVKSVAGSMQVPVKAGSETGPINFPIIPKPAEINVKRFPPSSSS